MSQRKCGKIIIFDKIMEENKWKKIIKRISDLI